MAKEFLKYLIQPKVLNELLKTGLGRNLPAMPAIVKDDPWWFADPHRATYTRQGLLGPTVPTFWTSNPAYAQVQNEHVWQTAWAEIISRQGDAAGRGREGLQAGGGDLLEVSDRADLKSWPAGTPDVDKRCAPKLSSQFGLSAGGR